MFSLPRIAQCSTIDRERIERQVLSFFDDNRVQVHSTMAGVGSDPPFLSVSVTEPVKMGAGMQAYISYRVSTRVWPFRLLT